MSGSNGLLPSKTWVRRPLDVPIVPSPSEGIADRMKKYRPITPGTTHRMIVDRNGLHKGPPLMPLTVGLRKSGGRNQAGKVTVRGRGGGAKRRLRLVDFRRGKELWGQEGTIVRLEYDPNRSGRIALVKYPDESIGYQGYTYHLLTQGIKPGDKASGVADP